MLLKLNAYNVTPASGWTNFKLIEEGVVVEDCTDFETGLPTGIQMIFEGVPWGASASGALTNQDHYGIPELVWDNYNSTQRANESTITLKHTVPGEGFEIGKTYRINFAGLTSNARDSTIHVNGVSGTYHNPGGSTPVTPEPPVELDVVAEDDGNGIGQFVISIEGYTLTKVITFITITDNPPKVVNPTGRHFYGQPSTYATNGFSDSIISANLAGIECTSVSDTGATMPALTDETTVPMPGERELEVSDGEDTATTNIVLSPPNDFNSVILGSDLNNSNTGTIFDFVPAAKEGDALFTPFVVDSKGNIIDAQAGSYIGWHLSVDDIDPNIAVAREFEILLGKNVVTLSEPFAEGDAFILQNYSGSAPTGGMQVGVPFTTNEGGVLTLREDGSHLIEYEGGYPESDSFEFEVYAGGQWYSATRYITILPLDEEDDDTTPDDITFEAVTGVDTGESVVSNKQTISGLSDGINVDVSITNGEYAINGGAFTSTTGTIKNGDEIQLSTISGDNSTEKVVSVTIGTKTFTWSVTTKDAEDVDPDIITFNTVNVSVDDVGSTQISNEQTISGINAPIDISVSGGMYILNGGEPSDTATTVEAGDIIQLVGIAGDAGETQTVILNYGSRQATFRIVTAQHQPVKVTSVEIASINIQVTTEVDHSDVTYDIDTAPEFGTATIDTEGLVTYTAGGEFKGRDKFRVEITKNSTGAVSIVEISIGRSSSGMMTPKVVSSVTLQSKQIRSIKV